MNIATPESLDGVVSDPTCRITPQQHKLPPHYRLKAGDVDPELGKTIKEIVICSELFIVYIDTELCVQWHTTDEHQSPKHCGEVLNLVATLEAQSNFITDAELLFNFRRRIGEGLARCLSNYPKENSITMLKEVGAEMKARNKEVSWSWYFEASYWVTLTLGVVFAICWLARDILRAHISPTAFDILLGAICGTFGALLSVTSRSNRLTFDANAGKKLHTLEGLARIAAGFIGALLIALAVKAGLIFSGIKFTGHTFALLLCACIVAGASERLVPSLISNVEKKASARNESAQEGDGS